MACACNKKMAKFVVTRADGSAYKTYSNEAEAKAAATRVKGEYKRV